jgi:hypothetical protein
LEFLVPLFGLVAERFNDCLIKLIISRNETPKTLATFFKIIASVFGKFLAVATAIYRDDILCRNACAEDALGLGEALAQLGGSVNGIVDCIFNCGMPVNVITELVFNRSNFRICQLAAQLFLGNGLNILDIYRI